MKQLSEQQREAALEYLSAEPEFNLFFLGDIEVYGMDHDPVHTFTDDNWNHGNFPYLILQYFDNYIVYSADGTLPAKTIADFLKKEKGAALSGKKELVDQFQPYFPEWKLQPTFLSRLDRTCLQACVQEAECKDVKFVRLEESHIPELYRLLLQIDEFSQYRTMTQEEVYKRLHANIDECGRSYGLFLLTEDGWKMAATAQTAAENSISAMVVGVATLPEYRKKGYASTLVQKLCLDCLNDGKEFLCLFYDNPEAGKIYNKIGFKELGVYTMLRNLS